MEQGRTGVRSGKDRAVSPQPSMPVTFTSCIKRWNMGTKKSQYPNVPVEFVVAHAYARRTEVMLTMRGAGPWFVSLKHTTRPSGVKTVSFANGWHGFCVYNGIEVGDSCCLTVEYESVSFAGHEHLNVLEVEIIKRDGTRLH